MTTKLLHVTREKFEVPPLVSDEQLLNRLVGMFELMSVNATLATALRGGYSEVVGLWQTSQKVARYRLGQGTTNRDGTLSDEHVSLSLEIKRLGTKSTLYKKGQLTGKTLFEMKSRKNPGSAAMRSSIKESTYTVDQIDVFASVINERDDTFYFASRDIIESGVSLYETCYLDLASMLLYCVKGGPVKGSVTRVAPLYGNPDDAADRQRMLKAMV